MVQADYPRSSRTLASAGVAVVGARGHFSNPGGIMRRFATVFFATVLLAGCASSTPPATDSVVEPAQDSATQEPVAPAEPYDGPIRSVVIDTDMSVDDLIAVAMLVGSPAVEVEAIAITGLFVRCPAGEQIMLDFLATIGASGIPVACGATAALEGGRAFPDDWRDLADQGWGARLQSSAERPDPAGGLSLIETAIIGGADTLVILGPPTTSAQALRATPELVGQISEVVMMAGAVDVPGNLYLDGYENPAWPGEWNVYVDPVATTEIFSSGIPVVMVGLDATNQVPVSRDVVERMKSEGQGLALSFAVETLERLRLVDAFDSYFWDQLAVAYLLDPAVVTLEQTGISVALSPEREVGRTVRDQGGPVISIATSANEQLFHQVMIDSLSGRAG